MASQPQEPFRSVSDKDATFAGANPIQSGINLIGNVLKGAAARANDLVDPVLDYEFAKKRLEILDREQVTDSNGAKASAPITEPTGIVPGTVNIPRTALIVGGVLLAGVIVLAVTRRGGK